MSDEQSESPGVQVRRRPQSTPSIDGVARQKLEIVAHLRDKILTGSQFTHRTAMSARQVARKQFTVVDRQIAEDADLRGHGHYVRRTTVVTWFYDR